MRNAQKAENHKKSHVSSTQISKNIIHEPDSEEEKKEDDDYDMQVLKELKANVPKLYVSHDINSIPVVIPLFRGLHICTPNFSEKFKQTYLLDSMESASILNGTLSTPIDQ